VASALVNTMQQVGGSIGTSALSTFALTATASYLIAHHTSRLAPAIAATHGYTVAFTFSAALLVLGFILTIVLVPTRRRLEELRRAEAAPSLATPAVVSAAPATAVPAPDPGPKVIPAGLCGCSPVVTQVRVTTATRAR
jgi:hypothetical protein